MWLTSALLTGLCWNFAFVQSSLFCLSGYSKPFQLKHLNSQEFSASPWLSPCNYRSVGPQVTGTTDPWGYITCIWFSHVHAIVCLSCLWAQWIPSVCIWFSNVYAIVCQCLSFLSMSTVDSQCLYCYAVVVSVISSMSNKLHKMSLHFWLTKASYLGITSEGGWVGNTEWEERVLPELLGFTMNLNYNNDRFVLANTEIVNALSVWNLYFSLKQFPFLCERLK